jgi:hypothetical protein
VHLCLILALGQAPAAADRQTAADSRQVAVAVPYPAPRGRAVLGLASAGGLGNDVVAAAVTAAPAEPLPAMQRMRSRV